MSDILQQGSFGAFGAELYGDITEWSRTGRDERGPVWVEFCSGKGEFTIHGCTVQQVRDLRNCLTRFLKKAQS